MNIVAGIDEAGRGCIIGPLVIACVSIGEDEVGSLLELGVRDSKELSRSRRAVLYTQILKVSRQVISSTVQPDEIDLFVSSKKKLRRLNFLEAKYMASLIGQINAYKVYVDSPDTLPIRFAALINEFGINRCDIIAEHKADKNYAIVSAASIVAKVERDIAIERLKLKYGDFGSGYPSDARTRIFLRDWLRNKGNIPEFARKSWRTWKYISNDSL